MIFQDDLNKIVLPEVYMRNGKECYYDTLRLKLIPVTPEETVRQRIITWCISELNVPSEVMIIEQHLSHYDIDSKDRADIIIHEATDEGLVPLAIIECKAPTVAISDNVLEQCFGYANKLAANYAIVTNGIEILAYHYNTSREIFELLESIPKYQQMISGTTMEVVSEAPLPRPSYDEMFEESVQKQYISDFIIGSATDLERRGHSINLLEAFLDEEHTLLSQSRSFEIIKDLGVRILSYGNAAGFEYVAPYRSFLIRDHRCNHQIVSIGFNAYGNDKTILCVAIDDYKKSHHALQLLIDKYMNKVGCYLYFSHTGKISVGHSGSGSSTQVLKYIKEHSSLNLTGDTISLGKICANELLHLNTADVTNLVLNLIEYALLRDEYRKEFKKQNGKA